MSLETQALSTKVRSMFFNKETSDSTIVEVVEVHNIIGHVVVDRRAPHRHRGALHNDERQVTSACSPV